MEWKSLKDELPPIGKKILITAPDHRVRVVSLRYTWQAEDEHNTWPVGLDRKTIEQSGGYWLEIPPLPEGVA